MPPSRADELEEAALLEGGAHLDVYGDALQEAGDIRGEIIALDRKLELAPHDALLKSERDARVRTWLGPLADQLECVDGFLVLGMRSDTSPELVAEVAARGLDAWVARIALIDTAERDAELLVPLAARRWPRVISLRLDIAYEDNARSCELAERVLRAMPRLRELGVMWTDVLPNVDQLRELRELVIHARAPDLARLGAGPFPVTSLGLETRTWELDFPVERWPALQALDLSSNFDSRDPVADSPVYAALEQADVLSRLRVLRVADLTTANDVARLQRALDRMPRLARLSIRRVRLAAYELHHPTAVIVRPPPTPWPEHVPYRALKFALPRRPFARRIVVESRPALAGLVRCYDELPAASRDAWRALWHRLHDVSTRRPARVPMRELRALFDDAGRVDWWEPLRDAVASTSSEREATVSPIL